MTIALTSSGQGGFAAASSGSVTLPSALAGDFLVMVVSTENTTTRSVSSITGAGLTWTSQASNSGTTVKGNGSVWTARATGALTSQAFTVTLTGSTDACAINIDAFSGVATTTPVYNVASSIEDSGTAGAPTHNSNAVSNANDALLGAFMGRRTQCSLGTGYTEAGHFTQAGASFSAAVYTEFKFPGVGSFNQVFGGSLAWWVDTALVLTAAVIITGTATTSLTKASQVGAGKTTALTGTITTALTKASISATSAEKFTGTLATHLTQASLSAIGVMEPKGTITTALTKVSMSAAGGEGLTGTIATHLTKVSMAATDVESFIGTITTRLTKISMLASEAESFTGAITTALTKASMVAAGGNVVSGAINTALKSVAQTVAGFETYHQIRTNLVGISQAAVGLMGPSGTISMSLQGFNGVAPRRHFAAAAQVIFTGAIVTNVDSLAAITIHAITQEVFIGHIVTNLTPMNFAQSLVADEIMQGTVHTRLGNASGQIVANVVQALLIISGPIVMALPPFRPIILGALLGSPGAGKWYSWRYTDS
jgi:hypothetical protein